MLNRILVVIVCSLVVPLTAIADPLPSWRNTQSKQSIVSFVDRVTNQSSASFVPVSERIAVFNNDGTLWAESPFYFQVYFAMDVIAARAETDASILTSDVLRAAAKGDLAGVLADGEEGLLELVNVSHSGTSVPEFKAMAREWLHSTDHPTTNRPFAEMIYQPMLELLSYLRDNDFKTFIVSGGGVDFIRAFAEEVYGIPPYQVIGSIGEHAYVVEGDTPMVRKESGIFFIDDKAGKPVGINQHIGRRPIAAFGNSDGDLQMLQWTSAGDGARFALLIHHTDAEREWAYDRKSSIGRLDKALDEAHVKGWTVVDMKKDWKVIYPFEQQ